MSNAKSEPLYQVWSLGDDNHESMYIHRLYQKYHSGARVDSEGGCVCVGVGWEGNLCTLPLIFLGT